MAVKLYIHLLFHFFHFIGFYVTFIISEFANYSVMKRTRYSFAIIFSFFLDYLKTSRNPDHSNNKCPYICCFQRLCTSTMNH